MSILALRQQIASGHFFRFFHPEQKQERWRDVRQNSVFAAKSLRVFGDVNEMDQVRRVRGVR